MSVCECGRVFGTLDLFDTHQQWDRTGGWTLTCVLPPGLVQDRHGTWQTPEGLADRMRRAAILADFRSRGRAVSRFQGQTHIPGVPEP